MAIKKKQIEQWQVRKLHTLKSKLGISEEDYRDALWSAASVSSSTELSYNQANDIINHWERSATEQGVWQRSSKPKRYDDLCARSAEFATPAQLRMIEAMWQDVSTTADSAAREKALHNFVSRITGISHLTFIRKEHVEKIVKAMQRIKEQQEVTQ